MATISMLRLSRRYIWIIAIVFLLTYLFSFLRAPVNCQEIFEMPRPVTENSEVAEADEMHQLDMDMDVISAENSLRFASDGADSTYKGTYVTPLGPKECSVCEELMPAPSRSSEEAEHQDSDTVSGMNILQSSHGGDECCTQHGIEANCEHCNLTTVPTSLSRYTTRLLLGHNYLTTESIANSPFKLYPRLRLLSLSTNQIKHLPNNAFKSLPSLRCLCLQFNDIKMDESLNSSLTFQPLARSLVYLRLNGCNRNMTNADLMYPTYALSFLFKLKYLFIDGIPFKRFENPDKQLTTLTHLVMVGFRSGYCNLTGLQSDAFEHPNLSHLDITDCQLDRRYVNYSAFENLERLQTITISNNFELGIKTVGELMYSFRNSAALRELIMDRISPRFSPCVTVYKHTLRYFQNTRLEQILATDNEIELIQKGALQMLPKTLKVLNMTANKIIFGDYIQDLGALPELTDLLLDGSEVPYRFPLKFPTDLLSNCLGQAHDLGLFSGKTSDSVSALQQSSESAILIPLPPKLFKIYMSGNGMAYTLNNIAFSTPNSLVSADLSRNIFNDLFGPIEGLGNLTILKMDDCNIQYISYDFFKFFTRLQILSFYRNQLGKTLTVDQKGDVFGDLKNLTVLNLSENGIRRLYAPVFKNMDRIKHIDLSQNRLGAVEFNIDHMTSLKSLNLKSNQIQTLAPQTMAAIDQITKGRKPLRINLSYNPISCDCGNLNFLVWLTTSGVMYKRSTDYYMCDMVMQPNGYEEVIDRLHRECIQKQALFAVVSGVTMVFMLAIVVGLAYRFRWTLRYWYHAAKLRFQPVISPENFEFDVFVSYSDKDDFVEEELIPKLQDEFHLRVMMHGLCFPAGGHITDSIHMAVTTSRKTLVVITKNMLSSHWCNYELMMARREAIRRGRQVLVFLFLEDLEQTEMTSNIVSYIRESTYIAYPPDPRHRRVFWQKLADDLGSDKSFS